MFVKLGSDGKLMLIFPKLTDDLLFVRSIKVMAEFVSSIKKRFKISKSIIDSHINSNGCRIIQEESGDITVSMEDYMKLISRLYIMKEKRGQEEQKPSTEEYDT